MTRDDSQDISERHAAFHGRVAIVTGAGGDIGRAVAARLASEGASLVLTDLAAAQSGLSATVDACVAANSEQPLVIHCDVTSGEQVADLFSQLSSAGLTADVLFNNAGYQGHFTNTVDYDIADFRRVLDVNVTGVMIMLQQFSRVLIAEERGGVIVNSASMAHGGAPNMAAYSASKAAVVALTKSAAKDLAGNGIRINCISPAFIGPGAMWDRQVELQARTPSQYFTDDPTEVAEQMIGSVPMRRYGSLGEVAAAVRFLLSDESSYVTAFNLEVSGGAV